jgi:hypothetical protein
MEEGWGVKRKSWQPDFRRRRHSQNEKKNKRILWSVFLDKGFPFSYIQLTLNGALVKFLTDPAGFTYDRRSKAV